MKKLGLALTLSALVALLAAASASAGGAAAAVSSALAPATAAHSADSGSGRGGDDGGDDHGGHHGDQREAGEDIRGNCDEAEHSGDAECAGMAASSPTTTHTSSGAHSSSNSSSPASSGSGSNAGGPARTVAGKQLIATVGPGFSITLKTPAGAAVKALRAGTYTVDVRDRSDEHNFHLSGRGYDKATTVGAVATQTWRVQFKKGTYAYTCDPHSQVMRGSLRVS